MIPGSISSREFSELYVNVCIDINYYNIHQCYTVSECQWWLYCVSSVLSMTYIKYFPIIDDSCSFLYSSTSSSAEREFWFICRPLCQEWVYKLTTLSKGVHPNTPALKPWHIVWRINGTDWLIRGAYDALWPKLINCTAPSGACRGLVWATALHPDGWF